MLRPEDEKSPRLPGLKGQVAASLTRRAGKTGPLPRDGWQRVWGNQASKSPRALNRSSDRAKESHRLDTASGSLKVENKERAHEGWTGKMHAREGRRGGSKRGHVHPRDAPVEVPLDADMDGLRNMSVCCVVVVLNWRCPLDPSLDLA